MPPSRPSTAITTVFIIAIMTKKVSKQLDD